MAVADPVAKPEPGQEPMAPTTTGEQDLQSAGAREAEVLATHSQRRINLIWEVTQASIAFTVVMATILSTFISGFLPPTANEFLLANAFFLVIGFYFGRTNHTKTGGVPSDRRRGE